MSEPFERRIREAMQAHDDRAPTSYRWPTSPISETSADRLDTAVRWRRPALVAAIAAAVVLISAATIWWSGSPRQAPIANPSATFSGSATPATSAPSITGSPSSATAMAAALPSPSPTSTTALNALASLCGFRWPDIPAAQDGGLSIAIIDGPRVVVRNDSTRQIWVSEPTVYLLDHGVIRWQALGLDSEVGQEGPTEPTSHPGQLDPGQSATYPVTFDGRGTGDLEYPPECAKEDPSNGVYEAGVIFPIAARNTVVRSDLITVTYRNGVGVPAN